MSCHAVLLAFGRDIICERVALPGVADTGMPREGEAFGLLRECLCQAR